MGKLFLIMGCTAAGKGAAARLAAERLGGRIISVDSMKVYRRMDIGTNKPSATARAATPHYAIDVVEPWESYSVAQFVRCADAAVAECFAAGAVPLAVGGTSLYIKALTEGLFDGPPADPHAREALRRRAAAEGLAVLHAELAAIDPVAAERIHVNDEKRIIRALEVHAASGQAISSLQRQWDTPARRYDCVMIGIRRDKEDLSRRINLRTKIMMDKGLRDEVAALLDDPRGLSPQAAQAVGYAEMIDHLKGRCSLDDAFERIKINTRRLAKKQRTWQRRFTDVRWIDAAPDASPEALAEAIVQVVSENRASGPSAP
jgi:tRNA dimethylallyltransferase